MANSGESKPPKAKKEKEKMINLTALSCEFYKQHTFNAFHLYCSYFLS